MSDISLPSRVMCSTSKLDLDSSFHYNPYVGTSDDSFLLPPPTSLKSEYLWENYPYVLGKSDWQALSITPSVERRKHCANGRMDEAHEDSSAAHREGGGNCPIVETAGRRRNLDDYAREVGNLNRPYVMRDSNEISRDFRKRLGCLSDQEPEDNLRKFAQFNQLLSKVSESDSSNDEVFTHNTPISNRRRGSKKSITEKVTRALRRDASKVWHSDRAKVKSYPRCERLLSAPTESSQQSAKALNGLQVLHRTRDTSRKWEQRASANTTNGLSSVHKRPRSKHRRLLDDSVQPTTAHLGVGMTALQADFSEDCVPNREKMKSTNGSRQMSVKSDTAMGCRKKEPNVKKRNSPCRRTNYDLDVIPWTARKKWTKYPVEKMLLDASRHKDLRKESSGSFSPKLLEPRSSNWDQRNYNRSRYGPSLQGSVQPPTEATHFENDVRNQLRDFEIGKKAAMTREPRTSWETRIDSGARKTGEPVPKRQPCSKGSIDKRSPGSCTSRFNRNAARSENQDRHEGDDQHMISSREDSLRIHHVQRSSACREECDLLSAYLPLLFSHKCYLEKVAAFDKFRGLTAGTKKDFKAANVKNHELINSVDGRYFSKFNHIGATHQRNKETAEAAAKVSGCGEPSAPKLLSFISANEDLDETPLWDDRVASAATQTVIRSSNTGCQAIPFSVLSVGTQCDLADFRMEIRKVDKASQCGTIAENSCTRELQPENDCGLFDPRSAIPRAVPESGELTQRGKRYSLTGSTKDDAPRATMKLFVGSVSDRVKSLEATVGSPKIEMAFNASHYTLPTAIPKNCNDFEENRYRDFHTRREKESEVDSIDEVDELKERPLSKNSQRRQLKGKRRLKEVDSN
ncbi:uncharacterized protein LOC108666801 [Hyalella azteca]|uniref:Uncharacterized protein LOC108666801 n=1 Tax=Hyalella azteca TaxID=294128 RepID=A0A8B7N6H3_HYAAZ|nr:uncharacterized protein LOC108666801 [Hyalella azteca]